MANIPIFLVGILVATFFFGLLPVIMGFAVYQTLQIFGAAVLAGVLVVAMIVLYAALIWFRRSFWEPLADIGSLGLVIGGWIVAKFATAIRKLGSIISFMSWIKAVFGLYPGKEYMINRREEIVQRGINYHQRGDVEIADAPETLARKTRQAYDNAGRRLSNGEVVLGLILAGVTLLPSNSSAIPYSELLSSSAVGAGLSGALVLVVTLRLSALDMILVRDPDETEDVARLSVYKNWNETMSNGAEVVKTLLMIRAMRSINESVYDFYLDWVFERTINGNGAGTVELLLELRRPIFAFHIAESECITPSEASNKMYGYDVFSQFSFGPGECQEPSDEISVSRFDSALFLLLRFKYEIRDGVRIIKAYQLAEEKDIPPEEASRELYDKNVVPELIKHSNDEEGSKD